MVLLSYDFTHYKDWKLIYLKKIDTRVGSCNVMTLTFYESIMYVCVRGCVHMCVRVLRVCAHLCVRVLRVLYERGQMNEAEL